jgi:multicomponent Na+:H+ antiporter subunit G
MMEFLSSIDFEAIRLLISSAFLLLGVFSVLVGMIGLVRLPDIYNRLHATTKIATMGAFFVLLSIVIQDGLGPFGLKAIAVSIFLIMTAPAAGHVIARAAYNAGIPPCDQTLFDAYSGKRQGDDCIDHEEFHEGSYQYLNIERREKDHIYSDHFEEHLGEQFAEELSALVHAVGDHTPDTLVEDDMDEGEELITGLESDEKTLPVFEQFEHEEGDAEDESVIETESEDADSKEVQKRADKKKGE